MISCGQDADLRVLHVHAFIIKFEFSVLIAGPP